MHKNLKNDNSYVELTIPLTREGVTYPVGTKGYLFGGISAQPKYSTAVLYMCINEVDVRISDDLINCHDFKYKKVNDKHSFD